MISEDEKNTLLGLMLSEHQEYYGTPPNEARSYMDGMGFYRASTCFGWKSSRGNLLCIFEDAEDGWTAVYDGRRHGLLYGGFLRMTVPVLEEAQRRGDWRYIVTSEKRWLPLETETKEEKRMFDLGGLLPL